MSERVICNENECQIRKKQLLLMFYPTPALVPAVIHPSGQMPIKEQVCRDINQERMALVPTFILIRIGKHGDGYKKIHQ